MGKAEKSVTDTKVETKIQAPVFNLNPNDLDFTDDAELQDELNKSGGKYFDDPGNVDLEIVAADFHVSKDTGTIYCKGDDTWVNVVMTLRGAGDKEIRHWLQVPTSGRIKYGKKDTLAVYKKLQQFFFALGEEPLTKTIMPLCQKYFTDPGAALVGTKVNADLGYEGPYVAKLPDTEEWAIYVGGKTVMDDGEPLTTPDRASAVQVAKGRGIEPGFVKIVKFTASKTAAKAATKGKGKLTAAPAAKGADSDGW